MDELLPISLVYLSQQPARTFPSTTKLNRPAPIYFILITLQRMIFIIEGQLTQTLSLLPLYTNIILYKKQQDEIYRRATYFCLSGLK